MDFVLLHPDRKETASILARMQTRILIDAGISAGALIKKLAQIHVDIETIQAILITHEHTDHIRGLPLISQKMEYSGSRKCRDGQRNHSITEFSSRDSRFSLRANPFHLAIWKSYPFSIPHDTLDPVGFTIQGDGV